MAGTPALSALFVVLAVIAAIIWMLNGAPVATGAAADQPTSADSADRASNGTAAGSTESAAEVPAAPPIDASLDTPIDATIDTPLGAEIAALPAVEATFADGYTRDQFGAGWKDPDRNGCDARNDILARDLTAVIFKPGTQDCVVASGSLKDPYTGTTIGFVRGNGTSEMVQIDHIVPLSWAWQHGAAAWTPEQRLAFANDPLNLLAVDGPTNASKSDSGPAGWLPPDTTYRCAYADRFTDVLTAYSMGIDAADRAALAAVAQTCPI